MERIKRDVHVEAGTWESGVIRHDDVIDLCSLRLAKDGRILVSTISKGKNMYEITYSRIKSIELKILGETANGHHRTRLIIAGGKKSAAGTNGQSNFSLQKGEEETYIIETADSSMFDKRLWTSWTSCIMRKSVGLRRPKNNPSLSLTEAYHNEVVASLKASTTVEETIEIFDDFAEEALLDLDLKEICFRSREIFLRGFLLCQKALTMSAGLRRYAASSRGGGMSDRSDDDDGDGKSRRSNIILDDGHNTHGELWRKKRRPMIHNSKLARKFVPSDTTDSELQTLLQGVVLDRLKLIRSVLSAFSSILFDSDSIDGRINLVTGPTPLDLDSWLSLLVCDVYQQLCKRLGCAPVPEHVVIADGLNASIATLRSSWGARSRLTEGPDRMSFEDIVLTPLKKKMMQRSERATSAAPLLSYVQRSVVDLQTFVVYELSRLVSFGLGSSDASSTNANGPRAFGILAQPQLGGFERAHNAGGKEFERAAGRIIIATGVTWTRQTDWEAILENLVVRLSELLDDFITSDRVVAQLAATELAAGTRAMPRRSLEREGDAEIDANGTPFARTLGRSPSSKAGANARASTESAGTPSPRSSGVRVSVSPSPATWRRRGGSGSRSAERRGEWADVKAGKLGALTSQAEVSKYFSSLETQEIMLHVVSNLLHFLALDSAEIRVALATDLGMYWVSIMTVFNLIVPRPERKVARLGFRPGTISTSRENAPKVGERETANVNAHESVHALQPTAVARAGLRSMFQGLQSLSLRARQPIPSTDLATNDPNPNSNPALKPVEKTAAITAAAAVEEETVLPVVDYGPPRFGLSVASWTLLVLARQAVEKIVLLVGLHASNGPGNGVSFYPAGRIELDAQALRDMQMRTSEGGGCDDDRGRRRRRDVLQSGAQGTPLAAVGDTVRAGAEATSTFAIKRVSLSLPENNGEDAGIGISSGDLSRLLEESAAELPPMHGSYTPRFALDTVSGGNVDTYYGGLGGAELPGLKRAASPESPVSPKRQ